jgi:hypothetical protein
MDTVTPNLVVFKILMTVDLPSGAESTRVAHGSPPELLLTEAVVGEARTAADVARVAEVGKGRGVSVGRGVCVGVSVGGRGVSVGIAA